jgi:alanyl-tRNA synthetase
MTLFAIVHNMSGNEIRQRFLDFFKARAHTIIPSAPLIPENDPTVLFNTAGMQPLVPYLMGREHPSGSKRLADSQKCVRTNDIDEVGDNTHLTFFEMLGNWSLGDYFKKDAITWSFEFLTSKEEGLGLDPRRLYITVFEGDDVVPRDEETAAIWRGLFAQHGVEGERIYFLGKDANWWPAVKKETDSWTGPTGPCTEMFYDLTGTLVNGMTLEEYKAADDKQQVVEIWNDVFMEYEKKDGVIVGPLSSKNVDTGSGLERITAVVQGKDNVFETDLFAPIFAAIDERKTKDDNRAARIVADHIRSTTFLISDGATPSNTDQGYILRRLIRRAVRYADALGIPAGELKNLTTVVVDAYKSHYTNLETKREDIFNTVAKEEEQFRKTLDKGLKHFAKLPAGNISGRDAYMLFTTYGFPVEFTQEIAASEGRSIDMDEFASEMKTHQEASRKGAEQKFKGGLADHSDIVVQYHTATHLMLAGLRKELGKGIHQAGSNITPERLRFDFTHPDKVESDTLRKVEEFVNTVIAAGASVTTEILDKEAAHADSTIEGSFWEKYPDKVTVYTITGPDGTVYSRELCGGPHVENTSDIKGMFRIAKEESSSAGVRRIKAVLE